MTNRALVFVALAAGGVGFLLGTLGGRRLLLDASLPGAGGGPAADGAELEELRAAKASLEQRCGEALVRARQAEDALAGRISLGPDGAATGYPSGPGSTAGGGAGAGGSAGAGAGGGEPGESGAGSGVHFFQDDYEGSLRGLDWRMIGGNLHEMVSLLGQAVPAVRAGQPVPKDVSARIQRLNNPVLGSTIQVQDLLPGNGVLGKFTSAPFAVNALAAALEAAGLPLDGRQEERILAIAKDLLARDQERVASYGAGTWALKQLIDEVALKGEFYSSVDAALTPAQRAALRSEETRDRVRLDLFSAALLYAGRLEVVPFKDEEQLAAILEYRVAKSMSFTDDQRSAVAGEFRRWAAGLPRDLLFADVDLFDARGMVRLERATAWATQFLGLFFALSEEPTLVQKQKDALRGVSNVLVPLAADRIAAAK